MALTSSTLRAMREMAAILSRTALSSALARRSSVRQMSPKASRLHPSPLRWAASPSPNSVRQGGQDRQGRQLPRHHHLQQRAVLLEGKRQQRREHRLLPRHDRYALVPMVLGCLPVRQRCPPSALSYNLATLQTSGLPSNMCILAGFPDVPNKARDDFGISLRHLVRQCHDPVRR